MWRKREEREEKRLFITKSEEIDLKTMLGINTFAMGR